MQVTVENTRERYQASVDKRVNIEGEINRLSDREAMGLSENHYSAMRFLDNREHMKALRNLSEEALVALLENRNISIDKRYASGLLLGMLGDPRIDTLNPSMVTIEGGAVSIGLEPDRVDNVVKRYQSVGVKEEWILKETPRFSTLIDRFAIAKLPVTNQEYHDFLLDNPNAEIPSSWVFGRYPEHRSNHPVYTLSEHSTDHYCRWLSEKTGRAFRMPTEVEWEYAATGPEGYDFPWGNQFKEDHANTAEFQLFDSTPVGLFSEGASPFGLLDMAGNVEEYTADDYWHYPKGPFIEDDLLLSTHQYRVARGGSFTRFSDLARGRRRHGRYNKSIYVMGFRVAESV